MQPTGVPAWFGVANLLLVVVGGLGFWLWRRRTRQDPFQLVEPDDALPPGADASGTRAQE